LTLSCGKTDLSRDLAKDERKHFKMIFRERISHKLWQLSKLKLNSAKLTLASSPKPKPTLELNNCNNWIDINTSQMMNKLQY